MKAITNFDNEGGAEAALKWLEESYSNCLEGKSEGLSASFSKSFKWYDRS